MAWAKLHTDLFNDPKLKRAARSGVKNLELAPWLILFAKLADDDGRLSVGRAAATALEIAEGIPTCRPSADRVAACMDGLAAMEVLIPDYDGVLRFANWGRRQGKPSEHKDAVAARVAKHRERRAKPVDVTPQTSVTVTRQRGVTAGEKRGVTVTPTEKREKEGEGEREEAPLHGGWPSRLASTLSDLGSYPPGRIGKLLKADVAKHGEDAVDRAASAYVRKALKADAAEVKFLGLPDFAKRVGWWVDYTRPGGAAEQIGAA
jgi:hypothetical protein